MPTTPSNPYVMRRPSSASRGLRALALICVSAIALWLVTGAFNPAYAGNGLPWFYFLGNLKVGPFPSQRLCKDDLGSCHFEHGPNCLPNPSNQTCKGIGPGFGVINGIDLCSNDCVSYGYPKGFYFVVVAPDGDLSLAGPYSKGACMKLSDECLSIGAIPNTEGSKGGP